MIRKQKLFIKDFAVDASIGVYKQEKENRQTIIFDIVIELENSRPPLKDKLFEVTDYGQFRRIILDLVKTKHYNLLEKLAHDISNEFFKISSLVKLRIRITKPDIFDDCKVSFELTRF